MPAIIELQLHATWPLKATTRQLHGLACAVFEGQYSSDHAGQDKPFTVWPLNSGGSEEEWVLRTAWLRPGLPQTVLAAYGQLRLGHVTCAVTNVAHRPATHAELAGGGPITSARVQFHSPTYFSQNGTDHVLPDPRLIIGSWRRRWNTSLPEDSEFHIDDDAWRELHQATRLAEFSLRTELRDSGRGRDRPGFVGSALLRLAKDASETARAQFGALTRFAEFCGTGAQTTHGFGATSATSTSPPAKGGRE